jgi:chemotaxis protein MotB
MKSTLTSAVVVLLLFTFASCGTNKKLKDAQDRIDKLQSDSVACTNSLSNCNSKVADLNSQISSLSAQNASLSKDAMAYRQLKQDERAQRDQLNAALAEQGTSLKEIRQKIVSGLSDLLDSGIEVTLKGGLLYVDLPEKLLFKEKSATLSAKFKDALSPLASVMNNYPRVQIYVVGHTDDAKIHTSKFQDNWSLSTERANSVVRVFRDSYGVDPTRLLAGGRSKYNPVASNDTKEGRAMNRRVQIILNPDLAKLWDMAGY